MKLGRQIGVERVSREVIETPAEWLDRIPSEEHNDAVE
jgi:hypothetical protein